MEESQFQSDSAGSGYFDPDETDISEQQFSASLENTFHPAAFVVEAEAATVLPAGGAPPTGLEPEKAELEIATEADPAPAILAGDPPTAAPPAEISQEHDWRTQVSAKVNSYKSKRQHQDRYPSLRLPFEPDTRERRTAAFVAEFSSALDQSAELEKPVSGHYQPILLESAARVLEFPRFAPPVATDELAEPMVEKPRILEAPEVAPPPPALGGILIETPRQPQPERRPGIDFPLRSSGLSRRLCAAALDGLVVCSALAAFGYIFIRFNGTLPAPRTIAAASAALLAVFWIAYQYCFLVYSGSTPGLRLTRLDVSTFEDRSAQRNLRRWRVLASCLSLLPLGLGYAWCLLDEDQLCWHDRITRTHLRAG
jgi:uncharacterized RDD family membrane protein YckC